MKKVYLFAALAAIIAGLATYLFTSSLVKNTKIENVPMSDVVVATVDIRENETITKDMVTIKKITSDSIAPDAANTLNDVIGKMNKYPVKAGEQIMKDKIYTIGEEQKNSALSYQLKEGEYAYSLAIDNIQGVSGFISKGDYVDVVLTTTDKDKNVSTDIIMRNIRVIKLSNYASNYAADTQGVAIMSYAEVVLSLNEDQVILLTNAQKAGSIKLILKSIASVDNADK